MCPGAEDVTGFTSLCFTDRLQRSHQIYAIGSAGPPVILLHELPGLTKETFATARQLAAARYKVLVPLLFGKPGESHAFSNVGKVCGDSEFACNRGQRTSPHVAWLRELAACARQRWPDGKGVGVIGMCLTGTFPLAMLRAPEVVAPVICQPTLPFNRWNLFQFFGWFMDQSALAVDPQDLEHAKTQRTEPLLGIRFKGDRKCQKKRFERLHTEFGSRFYRLDFPGQHHSTLVGDFCLDAFKEVLSFFNQHLRSTPEASADAFPRLSASSRDEVTPDSCRGNPVHHVADGTQVIQKGTSCSSA
jgi:dienelactone hydrolase